MGRVYETNAFKHCKRCAVFFYEFVNGIRKSYPEIYEGGTKEGKASSNYFLKWGWYASIVEISNDDVHKIKDTLKLNVNEFHLFLAHKIDKMKMLHEVQKNQGGNVTQL